MKRKTTTSSSSEPEFFSAQISEARRFYLDLQPPATHRLVVICGGCEHCASDYRIHRKDFKYYSIEFVARGQGLLQLAGKKYDLVPGTIFAYGPGVAQDIRCNPARPLVKHFVDFVGRDAARLLKAPAPRPGQVLQSSVPDEILQLFENIITAGLRRTPFNAAICAALVEQMILRIAETAVPPGTIGTLAFETYQRCRQFIETNYLRLDGLNEIADRCHVDAAYICRLFRRYDHQGPYQYLTRLKMRDAAQRLQIPGTLVKIVADELGFPDAFQFSRTFRRIYGIPPRRFAQLQRAE